jgi:hypothetical protein
VNCWTWLVDMSDKDVEKWLHVSDNGIVRNNVDRIKPSRGLTALPQIQICVNVAQGCSTVRKPVSFHGSLS